MGRVVHFEIHAGDPERAGAFYTTVFGWAVQRWGDVAYWLVDTGSTTPGINGAIVPRRGDPPALGAAVTSFVATIEVDDLDATTAAVVTAGGRIAVPRAAVPGIGWVAYIGDPDGNLVGLLQNDPSAF